MRPQGLALCLLGVLALPAAGPISGRGPAFGRPVASRSPAFGRPVAAWGPAFGRPVAAWGPAFGRPGAPDLALRRLSDGSARLFRLQADGARDQRGIGRFLSGGEGRVIRLFDQVGHHDLIPLPGTVGPLLLAGADIGGTSGLRFDNDGAFEGNPTASGGRYYAVSLAASGLATSLRQGFTVLGSLRLGNVTSIAGGEILCLGCSQPYPLVVLAGNADTGRPAATADDITILHGRSYTVGPPPPSTPDVFAVAADGSGTTGLARGHLEDHAQAMPTAARFDDLLLGTTIAGSGAGWEFASLLLYDRRLPADALRQAGVRLARTLPAPPRGTLVLDGSSVEAGMGTTALRNLSRLYEPSLPGFAIYNVAVGGARTADRLAALPSTLSLFPQDGSRAVLLCGVGANSLGSGVPPAQAYAQLATYVRRARALRPGLLVGVTTLIPNGLSIDFGHGAAFPIYNRMVRQDRAGADFVADRAADPVMGDPRRYRPSPDRSLSADGGHPNDRGTAILAAIDRAALRAALGQAPGGEAQPAAVNRR